MSLKAAGVCGVDADALAREAVESPVNQTSPYRPTLPEYRDMVAEVAG